MPLSFPKRRKDDQRQRRRRMRKGMFILPSLFTSFTIAAGYYAIAQVLHGTVEDAKSHFNYAALAIGVAVLADGLDGRIARITNTASDFGRELDSLADVIAFGVAPAILAWMWGFRLLPDQPLHVGLVRAGAVVSFLFLVAGAARLARFNIQSNPQPSNPGRPGHKYFVGMPIPAAAGVVCAVVHFQEGQPLDVWWKSWIWMGVVILSAFLMVSTWRFYSFKEVNFRSPHSFRLILLLGGMVALVWLFSQYVLAILALGYMLSGVVTRLFPLFRRRSVPPAPAVTDGPSEAR
jgi:CDP-diacylglycerol--serine O-phosphatidyltransferase